MTMHIGDILERYSTNEPDEIQIIKTFVKERFDMMPHVSLQTSVITIQVTSAALAGSLRPYLHELQAMCQTDKRLVIRIAR